MLSLRSLGPRPSHPEDRSWLLEVKSSPLDPASPGSSIRPASRNARTATVTSATRSGSRRLPTATSRLMPARTRCRQRRRLALADVRRQAPRSLRPGGPRIVPGGKGSRRGLTNILDHAKPERSRNIRYRPGGESPVGAHPSGGPRPRILRRSRTGAAARGGPAVRPVGPQAGLARIPRRRAQRPGIRPGPAEPRDDARPSIRLGRARRRGTGRPGGRPAGDGARGSLAASG